MNIWTFELSVNEYGIDNYRSFGENSEKLDEGNFRHKKSNNSVKNGFFQDCQIVPGNGIKMDQEVKI